MELPLDLPQLFSHLAKLAGAFLLAMPTAWEREHQTRIMGLRTFPLVAMASCGYVLMALAVVGPDPDPQARILQGLLTGIGFIGGGAILKRDEGVQGTATAASIWGTGILGAAAGYGRWEIAIVIGLVNFLVLRFLTPIERMVGPEDVVKRE